VKNNRGLTKRTQGLRIETVLPQSGPVAQLGARFHGMEEVTGSIPVRSTKQPIHNQIPTRRRFPQAIFGLVSIGVKSWRELISGRFG
jgi:hypothetical protein